MLLEIVLIRNFIRWIEFFKKLYLKRICYWNFIKKFYTSKFHWKSSFWISLINVMWNDKSEKKNWKYNKCILCVIKLNNKDWTDSISGLIPWQFNRSLTISIFPFSIAVFNAVLKMLIKKNMMKQNEFRIW